MKTRILLLLTVLVCLGLGCLKETTTDPNTGKTTTTWRVDPNKADQGEIIAETGIGIGTLFSLFWPALTPFVGLAGGILGTWRKMRPQIDGAIHERDIGYKAGAALAEGYEMLKEKHPVVWDDIKPIIEKVAKPTSEVENAIRGFRGLAPKGSA